MVEVCIRTRMACIRYRLCFFEAGEKTARRHSYTLKKRRRVTTLRHKFFSMRVVNACNSLRVNVGNAVSFNAFTSRFVMSRAQLMFSHELPVHDTFDY